MTWIHRPRLVGRLAMVVALESLVFLQSTNADAAWTSGASGSAAGAAATMPNGAPPSGTVSGSSVSLSWPVASLSNGQAVAGYLISQFNEQTGAPASVGAGCSGIVTSTSCTEVSVPSGTWVYTVRPVQMNWSGGASIESAPITVT